MNREGPTFSSSRRDDEHLGVGCAWDERLDAVERVAAAGRPRRGPQRKRVKQRLGLHQRQRRSRDVLADELGQVGRLLLGVAPQADRGRDGRRRQAGGGDAHVALRQRLAHQHGRRGRALLDGAAELLGHADHGQAQLVGLDEQLGRGGARGVGVQRGGPQALLARIRGPNRAAGLLVGRRQVEEVRGARRGLARGARQALRGGEGAPGGGRGARPVLVAPWMRLVTGSRRPSRSMVPDEATRLSARSPTAMPRSAMFGDVAISLLRYHGLL